jgi:flavin reductase (DIM6/NTAB) family NADH-FMN oxidoreductase RutF
LPLARSVYNSNHPADSGQPRASARRPLIEPEKTTARREPSREFLGEQRAYFMTFDSKKQRKIMGQFATGVTVVTTGGEAGLHGLTANAIASLSLNPPLVLVAIDKGAHSLDYLKKNRCFAVNILRQDQEAISRRFATPGPKNFAGIDIATAATAAPILSDCLAFVDCRVVEILPGGDHEIFVGEIVAGEFHGGEPLLYFAAGYRQLAE